MLPEYDFTVKEGERGKYYRAYRQGHTVKVQEAESKQPVGTRDCTGCIFINLLLCVLRVLHGEISLFSASAR